MHAMLLPKPGAALVWTELPDLEPEDGEVHVRIGACGVCRTDLHVLDGELAARRYPIVPGHEIVGRIDRLGANVSGLKVGQRVGIPWLGIRAAIVFIAAPALRISPTIRNSPAPRVMAAMPLPPSPICAMFR